MEGFRGVVLATNPTVNGRLQRGGDCYYPSVNGSCRGVALATNPTVNGRLQGGGDCY